MVFPATRFCFTDSAWRLEQAMFDVPGSNVNAVYVDEDAVLGDGRWVSVVSCLLLLASRPGR